MNRLRHPVRAIREPFGTAGLIVACIALVLALTGAAFAAAGLTGKQKKEVEKIAKKYAGKPGAPGAAGPQGPAGAAGKDGAAGSQGEKGAKGDTGSPGAPGAPGAAGKSAEVVPIATGTSQCEGRGGAEVFVPGGGEEEVCNGKAGTQGPEGEPWTAAGTLPAGAQETGIWTASGSGLVKLPLSFAIPLAVNVKAADIYFGTGEEEEVEVEPGKKELTEFMKHCLENGLIPKVAPGNDRTLCVYLVPISLTVESDKVKFIRVSRFGPGSGPGTGPAGGILELEFEEPGAVSGSYAVSGI